MLARNTLKIKADAALGCDNTGYLQSRSGDDTWLTIVLPFDGSYLPTVPDSAEVVSMSSGIFSPGSLSRGKNFPDHSPFSPLSSPRGSETILLVEDEEELRHLVREILSAKGYTVLECRDGEEALEIAGSHSATIHALLTDMEMPHVGGKELAEKLVEARPDLRVMFMTGYLADDFLMGIEGATACYLQKPFHVMHLIQKMRDLLDRP